MTNETIPPAGEVKPPQSDSSINPALLQAARSLHRCRLPADASTTIADAADELERLLAYEHISRRAPASDSMLARQSIVLDNLFHNLVAEGLVPGEKISSAMLHLALRSQKLCTGTVDGIHRRREQRERIL